MYPLVNEYPVGIVGKLVYVVPPIMAVVVIPPLLTLTNVEFVRFAPVKFVFVSIAFPKYAPDRSTNGPTK
jgi:ABC-type transport system involved in cytochrome c biogenesis permease subunit